MKNALRYSARELFLGVVGGAIYVGIELLWRGHSHWTMALLGGVCYICIGLINEVLPWEMGLLWQSLIGACIVTAGEFVTGLIVNVWLGLGVWDYSNMPMNVMGQICVPFCLLWIVLSCVAIVLDDFMRYWFFQDEKPHYTIV